MNAPVHHRNGGFQIRELYASTHLRGPHVKKLPQMPLAMLPPPEKDRAPGRVRLVMAMLALAALAAVPQRAAGQRCADGNPNCGSLGHLCHVANVQSACQLSCGVCVPHPRCDYRGQPLLDCPTRGITSIPDSVAAYPGETAAGGWQFWAESLAEW